MPRNIEIKARVHDRASLCRKAAGLSDRPPVDIAQDDTFFHCDTGRLKLRAFSSVAGELIFYRRADQSGPKESFYLRSPTAEPDSLRETLRLACGEVGRVVKRRILYLVGRTRIHVDAVEGLGDFMELEVVLADDEAAEQGHAEARRLMDQLGIEPSQWVECAYVDLLAMTPASYTASLGPGQIGR